MSAKIRSSIFGDMAMVMGGMWDYVGTRSIRKMRTHLPFPDQPPYPSGLFENDYWF